MQIYNGAVIKIYNKVTTHKATRTVCPCHGEFLGADWKHCPICKTDLVVDTYEFDMSETYTNVPVMYGMEFGNECVYLYSLSFGGSVVSDRFIPCWTDQRTWKGLDHLLHVLEKEGWKCEMLRGSLILTTWETDDDGDN